jgi:hypothetical protein
VSSKLPIVIAAVVALAALPRPALAQDHRSDRDDDRRESERAERMRPVEFAPGWFNYADFFHDPSYEKVRFFKDESDVVHLQGLATYPVGYWLTPVEADGSPVFVLPPGYRPSHRLIVVAGGNCLAGNTDIDGKCRVDIFPDGRVTLNDTLPSVLSLSSITFRVP